MSATASAPRVLGADASLRDEVARRDGAFSLMSANVLLPNGGEGWWVYKFYRPEVPREARGWAHRRGLLEARLLGAGPDVICVQEALESSFEDDFRFLHDAGYDHALHRKGLMRAATFWRRARFEAAAVAHKHRVLVTALRARDAPRGRVVHVVNAHITAGPAPDARLRQVFEALDQVRKEAKRLGEGVEAAAVVVCGDFNSAPGDTGVERLLRGGEVRAEDREAGYPGVELTSKRRAQPFGPFEDAYAAAFAPEEPPATMLLAALRERMVDVDGGGCSAEVRGALRAAFDARAADAGGLDAAGLGAWIEAVNGAPERGSEWRHACAILAREGVEVLGWEGVLEIYDEALREGKYWSVLHDLDALGVGLRVAPGEVFEGRYDRVYANRRGLEVCAVRALLTAEQRARVWAGETLPNAWHPSDHLFPGVVLRWR